MVRFFLYSNFHGKQEPTGSDYIRAVQLTKYWDEAGIYKFGENPDAIIFNKIFLTDDYLFPAHFEGIKILDVCDPMWLEGVNIVQTCHAMDAVTVPTEELAGYIRQFHGNVIVVPDRFDLALIPEPPKHFREAQKVVWFGYSHNAESLKPAMDIINELNLDLVVLSNEDPMDRWLRIDKSKYTFIKYSEESIYQEIQKADFAILPDGFRPQDKYKSNNKMVKAQLAGLPVAKTADEVREYMVADNRQKWFDTFYGKIREEYDVRESVKQMKEIIKKISESSVNNG